MPVNLLPVEEPEDRDALREVDELLDVEERYGPDNRPAAIPERQYTVADPKLLRRRGVPVCRDPVERRRRYLLRTGKREQYEKEFGGRDGNETNAR